MKVDKKQKYNVEFNKEDLKEALHDFMIKKKVYNNHTILSIEQLTKTESSPGLDPHDCDYYEIFIGIKCVIGSENG